MSKKSPKPAVLEGFDKEAWIQESTPKPSPAVSAMASPKKSPKKSPKAVPAATAPVLDDKFRKAQLKKLRQVEELKQRLKKGEVLHPDQVRKIQGEAELRAAIGADAPATKFKVSASDLKFAGE